MLVELTPDLEEIERRKQVAIEHKFEYIPQNDPHWVQEKGIYQNNMGFNFAEDEFIEKLDGYNYNSHLYDTLRIGEDMDGQYVTQYGVADNIEQIKKFYDKQIQDLETKWIIGCAPVFQDKSKAGEGGGWRWHKWREYIGDLNPQCEYLDDEDFGEDFKYIICFHLYKVIS